MSETHADQSLAVEPDALAGWESQPASWRTAWLAGLPHFFVAALLLGVTVVTIVSPEPLRQERFESLMLAFVWLLGGVVAVALLVAWRSGWPRWGASFYLYAFMIVASLLLSRMQRQMSLLLTLYVLVLVVWVYAVTWRDVIKGLLLITPVAILSWFPVLEFIPAGIHNSLQVWMLLVTGLAAVVIARSGSWRVGLWTLLGGSVLVGLPISYFRTYHHNIPPEHADPASLGMFFGRFAHAMLWSAMLVVVPLLMRFFWELSRRCGRAGRLGYGLAFGGLLVNLASNLLSSSGYSIGFSVDQPLIELLLCVLIFTSAVVFIAGVLILLRAALLAGLVVDRLTSLLLLLVAAALPLLFMFPIFDARRYAPTSLPFGLFYENQVPDLLTYGLGALLVILGGWLITRWESPSGEVAKSLASTPAN